MASSATWKRFCVRVSLLYCCDQSRPRTSPTESAPNPDGSHLKFTSCSPLAPWVPSISTYGVYFIDLVHGVQVPHRMRHAGVGARIHRPGPLPFARLPCRPPSVRPQATFSFAPLPCSSRSSNFLFLDLTLPARPEPSPTSYAQRPHAPRAALYLSRKASSCPHATSMSHATPSLSPPDTRKPRPSHQAASSTATVGDVDDRWQKVPRVPSGIGSSCNSTVLEVL